MAEGSLRTTLRALLEQHIDFILVGGLAAVLQGVPVNTYDIDIVHSREPGNVAVLLAVLDSLDAVFRIQPARRLRPGASHLSGRGPINLLTRYGSLDLLCTIGDGLVYEDLLPDSEELELGNDLRVRVLKLEKLIELKQALGGEKDLAMLPLLRRTLAEKQRRRS